MKKRVLFLISNLESGGVSKSMVSLLNTIDSDKYDVSLWIASPHGVFFPQIPQNIRVISDMRITALYKGLDGVVTLLYKGYMLMALGSILRMVLSKISKSYAARLLAWLMPKIGEEEYDLIVDYNGQHQLYYMVNKLNGKKKISFFHSDYRKWSYYYAADKKYYAYVDCIYTISDECVKALKEIFPEYTTKIQLIENISSPTLIGSLSNEYISFPSGLTIVTLGHICNGKGSDWAIAAAKLLKGRGVKFTWFFVGQILESEYIDSVNRYELNDCVKFVGVTPNPYPYLKNASIIVHPSRFEGKSIALDEAKLLCKPIVVTNFSTVHDQFQDKINATICEMNPVAIADAIQELAEDENLRSNYIKHLQTHKIDNTSEINKIYQLLEL